MRVYIASKYLDHQQLNKKISAELALVGIDAFLPESININAITYDEMKLVAETCYEKLELCDVILVVCPFGKSVASEIGYAIALKRIRHCSKRIVVLNPDFDLEAMICPYIDKQVKSISELINYLQSN